jgi:predicted transcriptional regulator
MSTLEEIRTAIVRLNPHEKALLVAELFAMNEPNDAELQSALQRGLDDVKAGRLRPIEEVNNMISAWTSKS